MQNTGRYLWLLHNTLRKIWVRVAGFALLAILSLVMAHLFSGRPLCL
jgi:uncharacterized membrane protein YgaE (UPF0421/DUF939 family)